MGRFTSLGILSVFVVLTGCNSTPLAWVPTQTDMQESSPMVILVPTYLATPTNTFLPTSSPTATAIPTLEPDEAKNALLRMVITNNSCELPCWWGLVPGKSTTANAYETFSPFTGIAQDSYISPTGVGYISFTLQPDNYSIFLGIVYRPYDESESIGIVKIDIRQIQQIEGNKALLPYKDLFRNYSLSSILSTYGSPSKVEIDVDLWKWEATSPTTFYTYLAYPDKGIYVRYTTSAEDVSNDRVQSCPSEASVELWLLPPENGTSYPQLLTSMEKSWGYSHKTLEEAMQMSIDQFYLSYKNPQNQCLGTPKAIWLP